MPYPPSRLARVSPTGPAPRISTSVSKGLAVEPFGQAVVGVIVDPCGQGRVSGGVRGTFFGWCSAAQQEIEMDLVEGLGVLVLRPVTAVLHDREPRSRDQRGDPLCLGDRAGRVLGGPEHQRGYLD